MRYSCGKFTRSTVVAACLALAATIPSPAQGRGGPGGGGPGGGMGGPGGGMGGPQFPGGGGSQFPNGGSGAGSPQSGPPRGPAGESRMGLEFGPPGQRWWDDRGFAKSLKLRPDQQTRMDAIFEQNRSTLLSRFEAAHQAEAQMQDLARSTTPDEFALFAQIDRVAQARADLEKANTHLLLQLRKEMDADQIKRLEKQTQH